jgi:DNA-directed RNA polymerase specialized sigma24 family protein
MAESQTQWTLIIRAQGEGEAARKALGQLVGVYQRTVRLLVGRYWLPRGIDVDDVVQDFFQAVVRRDIHRIDRSKGRFRGWLSAAVRHHVLNTRREWSAQRRGNSNTAQAVEVERVADSLVTCEGVETPEALGELLRAEALDVCDETIRRMAQRRIKPEQFELLKQLLPSRHLNLEPLKQVAARLRMTEATLRDKMNDLRAEYRHTICKVIADGLLLDAGENPLLHPAVRRELDELFAAVSYAPAESPLSNAAQKSIRRDVGGASERVREVAR